MDHVLDASIHHQMLKIQEFGLMVMKIRGLLNQVHLLIVDVVYQMLQEILIVS